MARTRLLPLLMSVLFLAALPAVSSAQGNVTGRVTNAQGQPLRGAPVTLEGTAFSTVTGDDGRYLLRAVAEGSYRVTVTYVGYADGQASVTVRTGATERADITLEVRPVELQGISALGRIGEGQAKALTIQKTAPNVKSVVSYELFDRFPDRNGAEVVQRIPGVAIDRDQGEGEHVSVRGLPPAWNAVTVNGQRIPALVAGGGREVGLDLVQAELFDAIEVTKGLTPDMDADAMGGSINFVPRRAPDAPVLAVQANFGLNEQQSRLRDWGKDIQQVFGLAGTRLANQKFGVLGAVSYYDTDRGSLLTEYTFDGVTETITRNRANDYDVNRERLGVQGSADYQFTPGNQLVFTGGYNRYRDDEIRRRAQFYPENGREDREIRNRLEEQTYAFSQLEGRLNLGSRANLRYRGSWARSKEDIPDRTLIGFRRTNTDVRGLTNDAVRALNEASQFPGQPDLPLREVTAQFALTEEDTWSGGLDLAIPFVLAARTAVFTVGAKYTKRDRDERESEFTAGPEGVPLMLSDADWPYTDDWRVERGRLDDARSRFGLEQWDEDAGTAATAFVAQEQVTAGYAMIANEWSGVVSTLAGVRVENTSVDYRHIASNRTGEGSYTDVLPSIHLTIRPDRNTNLRFGVSTGIARPGYGSLVPIESIDDEELVIVRGNPDLEATRSTSFDAALERYDDRLGLLSAGFFYKDITDVIATGVSQEVIGGETYDVTQPINAETASLWGIELTLSQRLSVLGLPSLRDFGILANYTYTDAKTEVGGRELDLPNAARHTWNAALFYDNPRFGFAGSLAANHRSAILIGVGGSAAEDHYFDSEFHLDASVTQRVRSNVTAFFKVNNLTNEREQEVFGEPYENRTRLHQFEAYGRTATLGVRLDLR